MERYERQLERMQEREVPELEQGYDLASESHDMVAASEELARHHASREHERTDARDDDR